jgi:beta-lactam-binding protein with PASTA domain
VIRRPAGARFGDPLQFAFAKIAWDGDVVMIAGMDGNSPRDPARRLLWATRRGSGAVPVTRGEDLPHAYLKLHAAGLSVAFTLPFSLDWSYECVPLVVGSVPRAGADVRRGSAVSLRVRIPGCGAASPAVPVGRLPSYRVPDFVGKPLTAAIAWIQHRNLYWAARIPPLRAGDAATLFANYTVTAQRPRPGSRMQLGIKGQDSFRPTPLSLTVSG